MISLVIALALATPDPALAALQAADARVANIAWRLQTRGVGLCSETVALPGFAIHAIAQYPPSQRAAVAAQFALGPKPTVLAVVDGSAADRAGLKPGDALSAIGGRSMPTDVPAKASYAPIATAEAAIEAGLARPPLVLTVDRGGRSMAVTISGDRGCASRVQIIPGGSLNAQADGQYVQLTGPAVDFAASDDELAVLIAHELSHNILKHRTKLDAAHVSRGIFAGFGKGGAALRNTEYEADRLGVWLVARAGYDLGAVLAFWTRLASKTDMGIFNAPTHPNWKERLARLSAAVAQVRAQKAAGAPQVPPAVTQAQ